MHQPSGPVVTSGLKTGGIVFVIREPSAHDRGGNNTRRPRRRGKNRRDGEANPWYLYMSDEPILCADKDAREKKAQRESFIRKVTRLSLGYPRGERREGEESTSNYFVPRGG